MKISKTGLVSTLALAGIVLGAVGPATTANAATSAGKIDETTGEFKKGATTVDLSKGQTAFAIDDTPATATSDANVQVISGYLTLDQVPDFSFGRAIAGNTAELQQGVSGLDNDGNQEGILRVTDSRNPASDTNKDAVNNGFEVKAKMAQFKNLSNPNAAAVPGFILNLVSKNVYDVDKNAAVAGLQTNAVQLKDDSTEQQILNKADKSTKGTYKATYKDAGDAKLFVPKAAGSETGSSVSKYAGEITWSLNASAKSAS